MDAVITWLDTTDKEYIEQRNKDFGETKPYDIYRVGKRDELRFCLRGLYYNMPWLRKIYLVTWNNQFPKWLDEEKCAKMNPPIIKIKQESLNSGKFIYGSLAVEACIHKIPNLSDLFIYANCDMFVTKKMKKSDWVENGIGKLNIKNLITSELKSKWVKDDILSQKDLFIDKFGSNFNFFMNIHQMTIMSKRSWIDIEQLFPKLYKSTINMKGRSNVKRITRFLADYIAIYKGYCKISKINYDYRDFDYKTPLKPGSLLLCTNLNSKLKPTAYNDYMNFMLKIFPTPLPSETELSYENVKYNFLNKTLRRIKLRSTKKNHGM